MTRWHAGLPYDAIRSLYRKIRANLFSKPKPSGKFYVVDATEEQLTRALGTQSYAPNWEFSYYKRGEDLNLARVVYEERDGYKGYIWWQYHVRGWRQDDGSWQLKCHFELEPTEYDREHILGVGFDVGRGMEELKSILDASGEIDVKEAVKI